MPRWGRAGGAPCDAQPTGECLSSAIWQFTGGCSVLQGFQCAAGDVAKVTHSRQCLNTDGQEVPCCVWAPDSWVPPFMSLASVMLLWTVFLFGQFRIFAISGTVAQWWVLRRA